VFFLYFYATRRAATGERYAEIAVDGQLRATVALSENGLFVPDGLPAVQIAVRDGTVGFVRSDCPDKICVHTGFLSIPGQSAVCLPNRVVVRVTSREEEALDGITH
jgi:hypothetical protein